MKGRKRKRSSKAGRNAKVPVDAEKGAGPSTVISARDRQTYPGDEVIAPVEVKEPSSDPIAPAVEDYVIDLGNELLATVQGEKPASDSVKLVEAGDRTHPSKEFLASVEGEKAAGPSTAPTGTDRRTHPRYEFVAAVEVVAAESRARIETRVRDLSQQGCYVDTSNVLPLRTYASQKGHNCLTPTQESSIPEQARAWVWCLPPLSRSSVGLWKNGLPSPARPPG
jgi:hypothetical protein